jgi:iduronate 2-sulfatase
MKFPLSLFAIFVLSTLVVSGDEPNSLKPNILLICVDDLKPVIGCYGDKFAKTPNIDRLAAQAIRFDRAYCNQAVCAPSRNALMTGLRPQTLGIYDLGTNFRRSRPDAVTIAQYFRQHGYQTQAMGKIMHVGHGNSEDEASWDVPHFKPRGNPYVHQENQPSGKVGQNQKPGTEPKGAATESADVPDETYGDGKIAAEAVKRLKAAEQSGEPFFMGVGFMKPHLPFVAPKQYWDMHDPEKLPQPVRLLPPEGAPEYAPQFGGELRNYKDMPKGQSPLDEKLTRHLIHGYYAATSYMDAQLGKVLDALEETGLSSKTIVILWGDHGWHLGDHGMWCKHTNYEEATRIPLIIKVPGRQGEVSQALVETVDLYPTLAQLAGLPAPEGLDGRSFAPVFQGQEAAHRDHVIHVYPRNNLLGRAIRTDRYRLVEWKTPGDTSGSADFELYDYQEDPGESKNLASTNPGIVKELRALLATHPEAKPQIKAKPENQSGAAPGASGGKLGPDRDVMFAGRDKNGDGQLTLEEFLDKQPDPEEAPKRFPRFDRNGDGVLTKDEFVSGGNEPKAP